MSTIEILEIIATISSLAFLAFLLLNKVIAWPFGILSSAIMCFTFAKANLFFESMSYVVYVLLGVYGWWYWVANKGKLQEEAPIRSHGIRYHLSLIIPGILLAVMMGYVGGIIGSDIPYFDAFTTVFALIATYLEARKVLQSWYYWLLMNPLGVILYFIKGFEQYAWLMVVYSVMSVFGLINWTRLYRKQIQYEGQV